MQAFPHPKITKPAFMAVMHEHREFDRIVQGQYWQEDNDDVPRGCAVGCSLETVRRCLGDGDIEHGRHELYEQYLGVPQILAHLEDRIFEGLPLDAAKDWPIRFADAVKPGADLSMVWPRFALWLLSEEVPKHAKSVRSLAFLAEVASLYREWCEGVKPKTGRWIRARQNAADDAHAHAHAAAAASAFYAAADDAHAAAAASANAHAAAYASVAAAAASVARSSAYMRQADKLVELIGTCD